MSVRRAGLFAAASLTATVGAFLVPLAPAGAQATASVTAVHGLFSDGNVDVYVDDALVASDVVYAAQLDLGDLDAGTYNVKMCAAAAAPLATITACADNAQPSVGPNPGTDVTFAAGASYTLLLTYMPIGDIGRPGALVIEESVICAEPGLARLQVFNASPTIDPATFTFTGVEPAVFGPNQGSVHIPDVAPNPAAQLVVADGGTQIYADAAPITALVNTFAILVDTQDDSDFEQDVLTRVIPLTACDVPPPTTVPVPPTTVRPAPIVTPRFAG